MSLGKDFSAPQDIEMSSTTWQNIDHTQRSAHTNYLFHLNSLPMVDDYKRCSYESCKLNKGSQVLDVGCGVGTDVLNLLKIVGDEGTGKVIGIDRSQGLLDEAVKFVQNNLPEAVQTNRATFVNGDVYQLPFGDGTFDASRTDRVLQHLDDPTAAIKEMIRVVKPGGRVVACEPHWGTLSIDTSLLDEGGKEAILRHINRIRTGLKNPDLGISLKALFKKADLDEVKTSAFAAVADSLSATFLYPVEHTTIPEEEKVVLKEILEGLDKEGVYCASLCIFVVSGVKREM